MKLKHGIGTGMILATLAMSACGGTRVDDDGNKVPQLMNLRSQTRSPDEFGILPTKPLTMPADLKTLPQPTPGGTNLTDPTPMADAVAALGGNPAAVTPAVTPGAISAGNGGLVTYAGRFGTQAGIRETLAAEDLDYRRKNDGRLLERLFNVNVYFKAYRPMAINPNEELAYWRKRGVGNPSAPPAKP